MDANEYAWRWFALHSNQRLKLVNFWLLSVAFLASAFVQAHVAHLPVIALGVSVAGLVSSLAFMQMDIRTRQLVRVAEKSLRSFETENLAKEVTSLVHAAHHVEGRSKLHSYRVIIQGLQLSMASLFLLAGIYTLIVR